MCIGYYRIFEFLVKFTRVCILVGGDGDHLSVDCTGELLVWRTENPAERLTLKALCLDNNEVSCSIWNLAAPIPYCKFSTRFEGIAVPAWLAF